MPARSTASSALASAGAPAQPLAVPYAGRLRKFAGCIAGCCVALAALPTPVAAQNRDQPEYRLKAALLYNFMLFAEWPEPPPQMLVCVVGRDPFGNELDALIDKPVGRQSITVARKSPGDALQTCQVVFFASSSVPALPRLLEPLRSLPVLTVADTPGAAVQGVALNMALKQDRVTFEASTAAARLAGITLSSKLLRFATEVQP